MRQLHERVELALEQRGRVTLAVGAAVWLLATGSVLSFNVLSGFTPLAFVPGFDGRTIFGVLEHAVANLILPVNALLIALFAGWAFRRRVLAEEAGLKSARAIRLWSLAVRWLAPVAVVLVLFYGLG